MEGVYGLVSDNTLDIGKNETDSCKEVCPHLVTNCETVHIHETGGFSEVTNAENMLPIPPPSPPSQQLLPPIITTSIKQQQEEAIVKPKLVVIEDDYGRRVIIPDQIIKPKGNIYRENEMITFVCVSDTHNSHERLLDKIPQQGNVFIHCGDSTNDGTVEELEQFNQFLGIVRQRFEYVVVIAGNHDYGLDPSYNITATHNDPSSILSNATHYLEDSMINLYGINIYGTPWVNCPMAFGADSISLLTKWKQIPDNVDILLTHTPSHGILDLAWSKSHTSNSICNICGKKHKGFSHWGEKHLRSQILDRIRPKIHICGHVHDDHGATIIDDIVFINCASKLALLKKPLYFTYPRPKHHRKQSNRKCELQ